MVIKQYEIYIVSLNPTIGHEMKKSRPCVIISPDEMNKYISTVIIAPITSKSHAYPTRIPIILENKSGWIVLDQIRSIDKRRLIKKLGILDKNKIQEVKSVIKEMLVD
ncbi:MAG: type II toxin-antitoxin system PemK/MazF family toxin [bacterium]